MPLVKNTLSTQVMKILIAEAASRGVLLKEVFLEISQNSQENTCARVSFLINLPEATLLKERPGADPGG